MLNHEAFAVAYEKLAMRLASTPTSKVASLATAIKQRVLEAEGRPLAAKALPILEHLHSNEGLHEIGGLGVLAIPGLDTIQAHLRARAEGDTSPEAIEKKQLLGEGTHSALDVGGLGYLMAPVAAKKALGHGW